jgi:hypothetical protein
MGSVFKSVSDIVRSVNQQPPVLTIPTPVTPTTPTTPMSPVRRFNTVVDPRLSRTMSRPMFRPSRYDGAINQLLQRIVPGFSTQESGITSLAAPQRRPDVDQLGRRYDDPRYYKMGGRVNYQNGGPTKTPPKFIPLNMESVAKEMFGTTNLDNLTYNQRQTIMDYIEDKRSKKAYGGRIGYANGTPAAGLAITSVGPTQQEIDAFINQPIPIGQMMPPASELLANETYQDYVRRKRRETGPALYANILPYSGGFPGGTFTPRPGIAPRLETTPQIDSIKEAMMSLPQTRSNPRMSAMRKLNQVQDPRMMRLMQMLRRQPAAMGGIMNLKMGGTPVEMDLRAKGGFVPIGKKERADDVPARLSKNEFVFTAKAVRNAGNGDIREGARKMYNLMNKLEAKR